MARETDMTWWCIHADKQQLPEGKVFCEKRDENVKLSDDCCGCDDRETEEDSL